MEIAKVPQLGQIVKILRGRDSGDYAVIVGLVDQRSVLIADGRTRKFDHPKKKNLLHLELQNETSDIVVNSLMETGRVTNGKLRHALAKYLPS
ncbi:50S ribosomal protein L14e [compost metagenome]